MKKLLFSVLLFLAAGVYTQAQDSIRAVNVFEYRIENGKRTADKSIVAQYTYDINNRLVLYLEYEAESPAIEFFTRYYYDKGNLISKERFTLKNKVVEIRRYSYDAEGNVIAERIFEPGEGKLKNTRTILTDWNNGRQISETVLNEKEKKVVQTKQEYLPEQIIETSLYKKGASEDGLKKELILRQYSGDTLISETTERLKLDKSTEIIQLRYSYLNGNVSAEEWFDGQDNLLKRKEYGWYTNNTKNQERTYDSEGTLVEFLRYEYQSHVTTLSREPMFDLERELGE